MTELDKENEIIYLRKLLKAYEKISKLSKYELSEAQKKISAYELVSNLSEDEILKFNNSMESIKNKSNSITEEIIKILDEDINSGVEIWIRIEELAKKNSDNFYSDLFYIITNLDLSEDEAKIMWEDIYKHTQEISSKLGRLISFRVGLLDYILEKNRVIKNPKIIELHFFDSMIKNSIVDELTDVYNKRYFNLSYRKEIKRAKRYNRPISIFVFDIDNFKKLNDTFGHLKGDQVLKLVGDVLKSCFRVEDTICRVGGEEFAVILPEISLENSITPCKRFAIKLSELSKEIENIEVTISGGISEYPRHGENLEELYAKADTALYKVKNAGKNNILCFETI